MSDVEMADLLGDMDPEAEGVRVRARPLREGGRDPDAVRDEEVREFAREIVANMSSDDLRTYTRDAWQGIDTLSWDGWKVYGEGVLDEVRDAVGEEVEDRLAYVTKPKAGAQP